MADAALGTLSLAVPEQLESPARRALRRLVRRKGAVVGMVVIATFILLALFAPRSRPMTRSPPAGRWCASRPRRCTGSAPTNSAAMSSAA